MCVQSTSRQARREGALCPAHWGSWSISSGHCAPSPDSLDSLACLPASPLSAAETLPNSPHALLPNLRNGPFKVRAKRYSKSTHKNTGCSLCPEGEAARPQAVSTATFSFRAHCSCVTRDKHLGKGWGAGGLGKQDAFPLTRAMFTQGLKQACSVPLLPGWESP